MKYANSIKLTVFSYEFENYDAVLDSFLRLFPFSLDENKVAIRKTQAAGFNERKIQIIEVTLAKDSLIRKFLENLVGKLDESQVNILIEQIESRLDSNLNFFIRLDKDAWMNEQKLLLTDSGKCFHIRISIAAFPKTRENAMKTVSGLFAQKIKQ